MEVTVASTIVISLTLQFLLVSIGIAFWYCTFQIHLVLIPVQEYYFETTKEQYGLFTKPTVLLM